MEEENSVVMVVDLGDRITEVLNGLIANSRM